ncbi:protein C9orf135 homolog isoform X1 [Rhinatrema bivittatum]|uniref:protein C9orf135 homolog isoform X1 n=1 Tax=Rhinatrema bivittatum TaxID=194408 RepID=UPI001126D3CC|nr:protein C9orf135 homolog isoform X1 [Rhinatrema bivittatum]
MDLEFMWPKPDLRDRKGSLTLRAQQQMIYGRPTLVYNWHCNRETEPKDYDVHAIPLGDKNLHHSTYKRLGTSENDWRTTTDVQLSQICLKKDYEEREIRKSLVNVDNFHTVDKRDTRRPERGYGAVLPHHPLDHKKMFLETTYNSEFVAPYRYTPAYHRYSPQEYSTVHRKCHSQFTEPADYRRYGRNTWQDESGIYANAELKRKIFKPTCPIAPHLYPG